MTIALLAFGVEGPSLDEAQACLSAAGPVLTQDSHFGRPDQGPCTPKPYLGQPTSVNLELSPLRKCPIKQCFPGTESVSERTAESEVSGWRVLQKLRELANRRRGVTPKAGVGGCLSSHLLDARPQLVEPNRIEASDAPTSRRTTSSTLLQCSSLRDESYSGVRLFSQGDVSTKTGEGYEWRVWPNAPGQPGTDEIGVVCSR